MEKKQFNEIRSRIDLVIRLLALIFVKDFKTQKDKIVALSSFGFEPVEIAKFLRTTRNTVNVVLSKVRRKKKRKTRK